MSQSWKWIEGIAPEGGVTAAARLSIEARLRAVLHWLPLAAEQASEDVEHVHRLRVATRRATAALKLYRDWLPREPHRWIKKRLRKIRQAAGEARDLDVLTERLRRELGDRAAPLLAPLAEQRAATQPAIQKVADRSRRQDRMLRKLYLLLAGIGPQGKSGPEKEPDRFGVWAQRQLHELAAETFAAMPEETDDPTALHQFRIRVKRLRYAMELLAPAFGRELREIHYPIVEQLQQRLGRINDHVAGGNRLREWSAATSDSQARALLEAQIEQEQVRLAESIGEFRRWWTPEQAAALRTSLATIAT
jgi:CHAD domain-containing protein